VTSTAAIEKQDTRGRTSATLGHEVEIVQGLVATGLTPAQLRAYRIADNKTAKLADWDYKLLVHELADLQEMDFDLDVVGFSAAELQELFQVEIEPGLVDPDDVPQPPDETVTRPGDLWQLGPHRLLCGDSAKPDDVDRLLDGAAVYLVNTDPPHNVKAKPRSKNAIAAGLSSFVARRLVCSAAIPLPIVFRSGARVGRPSIRGRAVYCMRSVNTPSHAW
jgi:hypothetical protein